MNDAFVQLLLETIQDSCLNLYSEHQTQFPQLEKS